tara:strand:- start:1272 stop:1595 length:324 start_codon:yes stop_codon:yes gene_type:complete
MISLVECILGGLVDELSDKELDTIISHLSTQSIEVNGPEFEHAARLAAGEWTKRYPNTICPSLWNRARDAGGFPSCYTGPTDTVSLAPTVAKERSTTSVPISMAKKN